MECTCGDTETLKIARGSTFVCTLSLPESYDLSDAKQVWVTFAQNNKELFTLDKTELSISANSVIVNLKEEHTLKFVVGNAQMQLRAKTSADESIVQEPITEIKVLRILKDGAIN